MPALAFGLKATKPPSGPPKPLSQRKAPFASGSKENDEGEVEDDDDDSYNAFAKISSKAKPANLKRPAPADSIHPPAKSPKLEEAQSGSQYTNLSSLRNAQLQDAEASKLDPTVYDYDSVYDTFSANTKNATSSKQKSSEVPKYMNNLLASAETRKRDQLRAKEKALQKERDAEGDEFADKEKFVTGAYKKQQEEVKKMEEEERKREEAEDERRRKGGGMTGFYKNVLAKDEEKAKAMEEAAQEVKRKLENGVENVDSVIEEYDTTDSNIMDQVNKNGGHIITNDEGEVVDKRQLLSAGLNVAPKKPNMTATDKRTDATKPQDWQRSAKAQDSRMAQRERQSRMVERQIEQLAEQQKQADLEEEAERLEKNKSKITESDKLSAKERYLQRKKEREEQAKQSKRVE